MFRLSEICKLFLTVTLLLVGTASGFTPDYAFKMRNFALTHASGAGPNQEKRGSGLANQGGGKNTQLSLLNHENTRRSITTPPAFEDYMAIRERSILRLLALKKD